MSSGGRPRSPSPFTTWKIHIDAALAARMEMLIWDPIHRKPRYGDRSRIIESLVRVWVDSQEQTEATGAHGAPPHG